MQCGIATNAKSLNRVNCDAVLLKKRKKRNSLSKNKKRNSLRISVFILPTAHLSFMRSSRSVVYNVIFTKWSMRKFIRFKAYPFLLAIKIFKKELFGDSWLLVFINCSVFLDHNSVSLRKFANISSCLCVYLHVTTIFYARWLLWR